ncbi:MAG: hypothetical protein Q7V31_12015 [Parvibaculum sp.]|uniref:hypothetical protein n=1 Tax=Parvibaculum sp. TaxID=2024848 RepID=UPI002728A901|nr:hypothetical protein [Parvibaculum sp.]MDO8839642.1 hypothetical protein [Parvibaculum sp.]
MAIADLATVTAKKGASTASLSIVLQGDGAVRFTDVKGNVTRLRSPEAVNLFTALNALV